VYIIPGSSESGAVPKTTFRVPPDLVLVGVELEPEEELDELDELPHAATAIDALSAPTAIRVERVYLLIDPPPAETLWFQRREM
jgi:hypothetical protein